MQRELLLGRGLPRAVGQGGRRGEDSQLSAEHIGLVEQLLGLAPQRLLRAVQLEVAEQGQQHRAVHPYVPLGQSALKLDGCGHGGGCSVGTVVARTRTPARHGGDRTVVAQRLGQVRAAQIRLGPGRRAPGRHRLRCGGLRLRPPVPP
nr:hypothetical protein [Streptomyces sp. TLI_235]